MRGDVLQQIKPSRLILIYYSLESYLCSFVRCVLSK